MKCAQEFFTLLFFKSEIISKVKVEKMLRVGGTIHVVTSKKEDEKEKIAKMCIFYSVTPPSL